MSGTDSSAHFAAATYGSGTAVDDPYKEDVGDEGGEAHAQYEEELDDVNQTDADVIGIFWIKQKLWRVAADVSHPFWRRLDRVHLHLISVHFDVVVVVVVFT